MKGWWVASKGLRPLPRRGSALAHGCSRSGRVVLPLARAAVISTGLRIQLLLGERRGRLEAGVGALVVQSPRGACGGERAALTKGADHDAIQRPQPHVAVHAA